MRHTYITISYGKPFSRQRKHPERYKEYGEKRMKGSTSVETEPSNSLRNAIEEVTGKIVQVVECSVFLSDQIFYFLSARI